MKKNKQIISILIIIVTVIILLILVALDSLNNLETNKPRANKATTNNIIPINDTIKTEEELGIYYHEDIQSSHVYEKKLRYVDNSIDYFIVSDIISNYINLAGYRDTKLINTLSKTYISEYGITEGTLFNRLNIMKLGNLDEYYYNIVITDMLKTEIENNIEVYIIKGNYRIVGNEQKGSFEVMVELDKLNNTYIIYPEEYLRNRGFNKLYLNDVINFTKEDIEENDYNKFKYLLRNDVEIATYFFRQLRELINYYPDKVYEKLNNEYSSKKFGNKNEFNNYIEQNKHRLELKNINEYKVKKGSNYTDYVCSDKYNNIYIFRILNEAISNYTIFLDDYTIMTEYDIEYYNELSDDSKATYNLGRFRQMLNSKDYSAIYNVLDNTFKNNNFTNIGNLKNYFTDNAFELNNIIINDESESEEGYYIFDCKLQNISNTEETKNMVIVINLTEETNFTMSFSFNETSE